MKINYTNNLDEIVEINHVLLMDSPIVKRRINMCRIVLPIILVVFLLVLNFYSGIVFIIIKCTYILLALLLAVFYKKYYASKLYKVLYRRIAESEDLLKNITLTLNETGICKEVDGDILSTPWNEIQNIKLINEHIVINLTTHKFFVVPIRAFSNEAEKNSFVQIMKDHINYN